MAEVLVVTDIFGCGKGLQSLLLALAEAGITPLVLEPYQGRSTCFNNEAEAYQAFLAAGGHNVYLQKVQRNISDKTTAIIAFSSGATAVWRALTARHYPLLQKVWLFYPGHIHQYLHLQPQNPLHIVLPAAEQHFCVTSVAGQLQSIAGVTVQHVAAEHGFINPDSANYAAQQAARLVNMLVVSLAQADI